MESYNDILVQGQGTHTLGQKKKNCYVALTRPKFENWVGRSGFFFFFFTYRERVEFFQYFF